MASVTSTVTPSATRRAVDTLTGPIGTEIGLNE